GRRFPRAPIARRRKTRHKEPPARPRSQQSRSGGMADAADSKSAVRKGVSVRVRPSALSGIVQESAGPETESEPKTGSSGPPCGPPPPVDVVEAALATALERAAAAGEWATVQALPWELEARRAGLRTSPAWTQARAALTGSPCWRAEIERLLRA